MYLRIRNSGLIDIGTRNFEQYLMKRLIEAEARASRVDAIKQLLAKGE